MKRSAREAGGDAAGDVGARPARRRRRSWAARVTKRAVGSVLIVVLLLLIVQVTLPVWLKSYVNRVLDQSPEYDGRIGQVEVKLWRGAYTVHDVDIVKTSHSVPVPFFASERVDFSLYWGALRRGFARGKIVMEKPRLNFVDGESEEDTQTGAGGPWLEMLDELFPFRIDSAEARDGEVHFQAFHTSPQVDVYLTDVQGRVLNLTNIEDRLDPLIAEVHATGTAMGTGDLKLDMSLDPGSYRPSFKLVTKLLGLDVRQLNALAKAYGDFDFEKGTFDFVLEVEAKDGYLDGYAKPLFRNVTVISLRDLTTDDPLQALWEALVGIVGEVFQNQPRDLFATRITLEGTLDDPKTNVMEIIGNVLKNAFVRAYLPRIEGKVAPELATPGAGGRE